MSDSLWDVIQTVNALINRVEACLQAQYSPHHHCVPNPPEAATEPALLETALLFQKQIQKEEEKSFGAVPPANPDLQLRQFAQVTGRVDSQLIAVSTDKDNLLPIKSTVYSAAPPCFLGWVADIFGKVTQPFYSIRLHNPALKVTSVTLHCPLQTALLGRSQIDSMRQRKATDGEEGECSSSDDDEDEARSKARPRAPPKKLFVRERIGELIKSIGLEGLDIERMTLKQLMQLQQD